MHNNIFIMQNELNVLPGTHTQNGQPTKYAGGTGVTEIEILLSFA